jgi:small subunit ribosomal protein S7
MRKKPTASKKTLIPDPRCNSILATKFINKLMLDGKKAVAQRIFYKTLDLIGKRLSGEDPVKVFEKAIENVRPVIEVKSKRVGGSTYQVPIEVPPQRRQSLAIRWIVEFARSRKGKPMYLCLADEIIAAYNREGAAYTQKENVHKMAEANKAFAHFAW